MADARIRELERRVAGGDPEAEASLLLARFRTGTLAGDRLRLAAYLGDRAAREALREEDERPVDLETWVRGLCAWGETTSARAAIALAHTVLPAWETWELGELAPARQLRVAADALAAWLLAPEDTHAGLTAGDELQRADEVIDGASHLLAIIDAEHPRVVRRSSWHALACGWAALASLRAAHWHLAPRHEQLRRDAAWAARECAQALGGDSGLRRSIRSALVPWALHRFDPLRGV